MLPRARLSTLTLTPTTLSEQYNSRLAHLESEKNTTSKCSKINWKCKWDFYVAILSFALDSSSWTRLTESCLEYGGAAYLVARIVSIVLVGVPLLIFEIGIGQLSGISPLKFFGNNHSLRPIFCGVGIFLMISSVYKAIGDSASSTWAVSAALTLIVGDTVEGLHGNTSISYKMIHPAASTVLQGFTHLDPLTVISLSITWVFGVLTVICGLRFISKVSYFTLVVPFLLIISLVGRALHSNPTEVYNGLSLLLAPSWPKLLSLSLWSRAVTDTVLSFNLGLGVIMFLSTLDTSKFNCLKTSVTLASLHTVMLGLMLILSGSSSSAVAGMKSLQSNHTTEATLKAIAVGIEQQDVWFRLILYAAVFLLNVDGLIFISNCLASSFSNLRWRPVLAVLIGAFLYIICLPLATGSHEMYLDTIERFTCNLLPIMGFFFMLVSVVSSLRPSSTVDVIEFATRSKLGFRGQSYVFVLYNAILPLLLLMCIIDGLVHATWSDGDQLVYGGGGSDSSSGLAAIGHLLLWLPWGSLVLTPFYLAACHWRHLPRTKRWRELWRKTNYEDWLYRRSSQLASADDDSNENSIYELPERVSSSRPMATSSSYYSSATILASDSAVYSAYY